MSVRAKPHPFALPAADRAVLLTRLAEAVQRARRSGGTVLAARSWSAGGGLDPTAIVAASRRDGEPWFWLEEPDRDGAPGAALVCLIALEADGADRFPDVARRWRALAAAAV